MIEIDGAPAWLVDLIDRHHIRESLDSKHRICTCIEKSDPSWHEMANNRDAYATHLAALIWSEVADRSKALTNRINELEDDHDDLSLESQFWL